MHREEDRLLLNAVVHVVFCQDIPNQAVFLHSICTIQQYFAIQAGINSIAARTPTSFASIGCLGFNISFLSVLLLL